MKYFVQVTRLAPQTMVLEVEAPTEAAAREKAIQQAQNEDFGGKEKEANYEIDAVWLDRKDLW